MNIVAAFMTLLLVVSTPVAASALTGSESAFGYQFTDSSEGGGPAYSFDDISSSGTRWNSGDDETLNVQIGFGFSFYGITYTDLWLGSNGYLTFGSGSTEYLAYSFPYPGLTTPMIAPLFLDLATSAGGGIYYETKGSAPNRTFIVQWQDSDYSGSITADRATFQAILHEGTGQIDFQYADVSFGDPAYDMGAAGTVGIDRADSTTALQYSYNTPSLAAGLAIRFFYIDADGDGFPDVSDTCADMPNSDQSNIVCDPTGDYDGDGILNNTDNCSLVPNSDQQDTDSDGIGDACDPDIDGDTILNAADNCPLMANPDQKDTDSDGMGDACDDDIDGDTILNAVDNCPLVFNGDQTDMDGNDIGDLCDADIDGDGLTNEQDNCPLVANPGQADSDSDGSGDACTTVHCVSTSAGLQAALDTAAGNGKDNIIRLVQGTYLLSDNGGQKFAYTAIRKPQSLRLLGGYTPGCSSWVADPFSTILDGEHLDQSASGAGGVLSVTLDSPLPYVDFVLDGLTIENGAADSAAGLSVHADGPFVEGLAGITIRNTVISNNTLNPSSGFSAGGLSVNAHKGNILLANNLITGNRAVTYAGGGLIRSTAGRVDIINNTVTGNVVDETLNGTAGGLYIELGGAATGAYVYNNILFGNSAWNMRDIVVNSFSSGPVHAFNNDIGDAGLGVMSLFTAQGNNISEDPLFAGPADYHLAPASPAIDAGSNSAPSLQVSDIVGAARLLEAAVDIGAYESPDIPVRRKTGDVPVEHYNSLQEAFTDAPSADDVLEAKEMTFAGGLLCSQSNPVLLKGGFNPGFLSNAGRHTIISPLLTISGAAVTTENITIR